MFLRYSSLNRAVQKGIRSRIRWATCMLMLGCLALPSVAYGKVGIGVGHTDVAFDSGWWRPGVVTLGRSGDAPYADRERWLRHLLPNKIDRLTRHKTTGVGTTGDVRSALVSMPEHGELFEIGEIVGVAESATTILLIPQYHASNEVPLTWSSAGAEIAAHQSSIDALLGALVTRVGLRCVGTEGSAARRLRRSQSLDRLARWARDLSVYYAALVARESELPDVKRRAVAAAQRMLGSLAPFISRNAMMHSGSAAATAIAAGGDHVWRFGLEESVLLREATTLQKRLLGLERRLAEAAEGGAHSSAATDALTRMWLDEFPHFNHRVLLPMQTALDDLRRIRLEMRTEGLTDEAKRLGEFSGMLRMVATAVLEPQQVSETFEAHADIARAAIARDNTAGGNLQPPAAAQQNRLVARLQRKTEKTRAQYHRVTYTERERVAVENTVRQLATSGTRVCAMVFGANHRDGLLASIERYRTNNGDGGRSIAAIVLNTSEL